MWNWGDFGSKCVFMWYEQREERTRFVKMRERIQRERRTIMQQAGFSGPLLTFLTSAEFVDILILNNDYGPVLIHINFPVRGYIIALNS